MLQKRQKKLLPDLVMWEAYEFQLHQRSQGWYILAGLVCLALLAYAIYSQSLLTLITFGLIILTGLGFALKKPKKLVHRITSLDVSVGQTIYPYKNIRKFWIVYHPPEIKTLNFETTAYLNSVVTLQLNDQDPMEVKKMLQRYLPEDLDHAETFTDVLARKAKF